MTDNNQNINETEQLTTKEKKELIVAEWFPPQSYYKSDVFSLSGNTVDKFGIPDQKEYRNVIKMSRFFYRHDPIASTVVNKLIDIGITDINFFKGTLSENELRIFEGIKPELRHFIEECTLEYLLTGLVIPEVRYAVVNKEQLRRWGVKKMDAFTIPIDMWIRDSSSIIINRSFISSKSSYFVEIDDNMIFFIKNKGKYKDGTVDTDLYRKLLAYYPDFVKLIQAGETKILLEDPFVIERRKLADSQYPIPYTYGALEALKHKRNLRKMDYSIASRVITAIQIITLGNDTFPLTEDSKDQLDDLKQQLYYRNTGNVDMERVFQLFGNHTLDVRWVFPETSALLDDKKYANINSDILMAFGFPKILVTGETDRTGTSQPEFAILSPLKTMESFREKLMVLLNKIVDDIVEKNRLNGRPIVDFAAINLNNFEKFFEMLSKLYEQGNISRDTLVNVLGLDINTELQKRKEEKKKLEDLGLEDFSPVPHSNAPNQQGNNNTQNKNQQEKEDDNNKE